MSFCFVFVKENGHSLEQILLLYVFVSVGGGGGTNALRGQKRALGLLQQESQPVVGLVRLGAENLLPMPGRAAKD